MKGLRPKKITMTVNQQFLVESLEESIHNSLGDAFLENLQYLSQGDAQTYVNLLRGAYYASMEQKTLNKLISQSIK